MSMTDGYDCYQNAMVEETLNSILKGEYLLYKASDISEATKMFAKSIKIYN